MGGGIACAGGAVIGATPGRGGTGCDAAMGGGTGTLGLGEPLANGAKVPVAADGKAGSSSLTEAVPCAGPIDAVRRLTD
jgi:hypothetical protein